MEHNEHRAAVVLRLARSDKIHFIDRRETESLQKQRTEEHKDFNCLTVRVEMYLKYQGIKKYLCTCKLSEVYRGCIMTFHMFICTCASPQTYVEEVTQKQNPVSLSALSQNFPKGPSTFCGPAQKCSQQSSVQNLTSVPAQNTQ